MSTIIKDNSGDVLTVSFLRPHLAQGREIKFGQLIHATVMEWPSLNEDEFYTPFAVLPKLAFHQEWDDFRDWDEPDPNVPAIRVEMNHLDYAQNLVTELDRSMGQPNRDELLNAFRAMLESCRSYLCALPTLQH